ncbi:hypothetical protein ACIHDR_48905 [Nocardia sp. NPDC052278]|uniref:hypothetical protein n=1 Tax=unclassified Nocardia TaxID=2637762 RepID=UPI00368DA7C6
MPESSKQSKSGEPQPDGTAAGHETEIWSDWREKTYDRIATAHVTNNYWLRIGPIQSGTVAQARIALLAELRLMQYSQ